ncbi:hypothetical protein [Xenorhabdus littoralis]|nr:hypothetical protein [Xenorhabdus sp. Reich]
MIRSVSVFIRGQKYRTGVDGFRAWLWRGRYIRQVYYQNSERE